MATKIPLTVNCGACVARGTTNFSSFITPWVTVWIEPRANFAAEVDSELEKQGLTRIDLPNYPMFYDGLHQRDSVVVDGVAHSRIFEQFTYKEPDWSRLPDWAEWSKQEHEHGRSY